jgi:putative mycofactocin binding protein MftB
VSLRDEPFGALAYHHGTRRLIFLKSRALAELVRGLGDHASARDALAGVADSERPACATGLRALAESGIISGD